MYETARVLGVNQVSRQEVSAKWLPSTSPREAALEGLRRRNALLDGLFYDVGTISSEEARLISPWLAQEGAIIIVPPTGQGELALCATVDDFAGKGGETVGTLAVAGVGSSALGSAAFARNVADATGSAVAAVVSGYGLADLITEALGGYFMFGQLNGLRHMFEGLDVRAALPTALPGNSVLGSVRKSRDTATLVALLTDSRFAFTLLTGHSKGNLVISEALFTLQERAPDRLAAIAEATDVVTVSATITMPRAFRHVLDIMGEWDWFGGINSRPTIRPEIIVPQAWHHTNTEYPAHLPVTATLKGALRKAA